MMYFVYLICLLLASTLAQDEDYVEDLNPSRFKLFGPFRDPPIRIASTTTEKSSQFEDEFQFNTESTNNEKNKTTGSTKNETRDEFVLGETTSSDNNAVASNSNPVQQNNCQFVCQQPVNQCNPQPCNFGLPSAPCFCMPRPPPLCPLPPPILICPPPACPKPASCPPCISIPSIPPPCICPANYPSTPPQNDCCCNCNRPCRTTQRSKFQSIMLAAKTRSHEIEQSRCNSQQIRQIIAENMSHDLEKSKHKILMAARELMRKTLNVVCGSGEFSYIVQTQTYCQYSIGHTTCYVFESV